MYQFGFCCVAKMFQLFQYRKKIPGSGLTTPGYQFSGNAEKNQTAFQW